MRHAGAGLSHELVCSLARWLVGWLAGWLVGWLAGWLVRQPRGLVGGCAASGVKLEKSKPLKREDAKMQRKYKERWNHGNTECTDGWV